MKIPRLVECKPAKSPPDPKKPAVLADHFSVGDRGPLFKAQRQLSAAS
jgi:hypothetical protein